jgi:hypothetical protein
MQRALLRAGFRQRSRSPAWSLLSREVNPLQSHRRPANDPPHTITEGETLRRVVTGHDENGRAIVSIDETSKNIVQVLKAIGY